MATSGITVEMYHSLEATLKIYQDKVTAQGHQSLTREDITTLKNVDAVARLIRFSALQEIVKKAIKGDYSKVIEYYSQIEKSYQEQISKLQIELDEVSAKIVEAISRGDINSEKLLVNEYDEIKNKIRTKNFEYDDFIKNQLKPEDFVKKILGAESRELVASAVRDIVNSSEYISRSKLDYLYPTLYSFSRDGDVIVNDDLVQLTIDYLNGNRDDLNNLFSIQSIKNKLINTMTNMKSNLNVMYSIFEEYQELLSKRKIYAEAIENIRFSRSPIFRGEFKGYRKFNIEASISKFDKKIHEISDQVRTTYNEIVKNLKDRIPSLPIFEEVFLSETNLNQFMTLVKNEYEKLMKEREISSSQRIAEISAKTNPRYLELDPAAIDRIVYYGRGRIERGEFDNIKENLKLLSIASETQLGIQNPSEIISGEDITAYQIRVQEAIDEFTLPRTM